MPLRPFLLLPLLLALTACSDTSTTADDGASPAAQSGYPDTMEAPAREVDPALMAPAAPRAMRGAYVFGHETESFQECGNASDWWVEGDDAVLEPLRTLARQQSALSGDPYHPIYVEATGELLGKDVEGGFATDFDNAVKLDAVTRTEAALPPECSLPLE